MSARSRNPNRAWLVARVVARENCKRNAEARRRLENCRAKIASDRDRLTITGDLEIRGLCVVEAAEMVVDRLRWIGGSSHA